MTTLTEPQEIRVTRKRAFAVYREGGSSAVFAVDTVALTAALSGRLLVGRIGPTGNGTVVNFGGSRIGLPEFAGDPPDAEDGDAWYNTATNTLRGRQGGVNSDLVGGGTFLSLADTPASYAGQAGKVPVVNPGETALEFTTSAAGSQGPPGIPGEEGEEGQMGFPGPQGAQGITGAAGAPGDPGLAGLVGYPGFDGEEGEPGFPGPSGPAGTTGEAGTPGAEGATGPQGLPGMEGPEGEAGEIGFPGPAGAVGATGPQGIPGDPGAAGSQGAQGQTGPMGLDGPEGEPGEIGFPGPVGASGSAGAQGDPGTPGAPGLMGPPGLDADEAELSLIPGPTGATGATGATGGAGAAGAAGVAGPPGLDGEAGEGSFFVGHPNLGDLHTGYFLAAGTRDITGAFDITKAAGALFTGTVTGEANPSMRMQTDRLEFGPGGATALDTIIKRNSAGAVYIEHASTPQLALFVTGEAVPRMVHNATDLSFGPGTGAVDTSLIRLAAGVWKVNNLFDFGEIATPTSPAADRLRLYAKDDAGVTRPYAVDSDGLAVELAGYTLLAVVTLGGTAGTLASFTSIPAKFRNLRVVFVGTSAAGSALRNVGIRLNGDAGANYFTQAENDGTQTETISGTSISLGGLDGVNAGRLSWGQFDIFAYTSAMAKGGVSLTGHTKGAVGAGFIARITTSFAWNSTAAVNQIDIFSDAATAQFAANSIAYLYGY